MKYKLMEAFNLLEFQRSLLYRVSQPRLVKLCCKQLVHYGTMESAVFGHQYSSTYDFCALITREITEVFIFELWVRFLMGKLLYQHETTP